MEFFYNSLWYFIIYGFIVLLLFIFIELSSHSYLHYYLIQAVFILLIISFQQTLIKSFAKEKAYPLSLFDLMNQDLAMIIFSVFQGSLVDNICLLKIFNRSWSSGLIFTKKISQSSVLLELVNYLVVHSYNKIYVIVVLSFH